MMTIFVALLLPGKRNVRTEEMKKSLEITLVLEEIYLR